MSPAVPRRASSPSGEPAPPPPAPVRDEQAGHDDAGPVTAPAVEAAAQAPPEPAPTGKGTTYLLVDGENIDATLGMSVLGHRPGPDERPRWDRVLSFARDAFDQPVKGLFFLNASSGSMPMTFVQALLAIGFQPIPLAGTGSEKVVDVGIQRTLAAIAARDGDVMLASHDGDFLDDVSALLTVPSPSGRTRRVGLLGFREFVNSRFSGLSSQGIAPPGENARGLRLYDLEDDVEAFTFVLPRTRVIPLESFDPTRYL